MKHLHYLLFAASVLIGGPGVAQDSARCDCTTVVGSCSANVTVKDQSIEVRSSTATCSRVDYFVDGQPFVALVVDGAANQQRPNSSGAPEVLVTSCQVCSEGTSSVEPATANDASVGVEPGPVAKLEPLIRVTPRYPERARLNRVQGNVVVEFAVNADGTVERPRVLSASPRRTFEQAAMAAVKRWRYPAREPDAQTVTLREQIDFKLEGTDQLTASNGRQISTRPRPINRPRNDCIRESVSYDYGDQVEVGLINACQAPVVVYACGIGTGNSTGLWVCLTPERTGTALVRHGIDAMNSAISGGHDLRYVEDQFLMRAPNSQYWWIACEPSDARCRTAGLEWTSDIQRTPSTVDPQKTARIKLARSR
jgi:TonB family protein